MMSIIVFCYTIPFKHIKPTLQSLNLSYSVAIVAHVFVFIALYVTGYNIFYQYTKYLLMRQGSSIQ